MPVEQDLSRGPAGRVLLDAAGEAIGRYDHRTSGDVAIADLFEREPGVTVERAAAAVLAELRGTKIAGDEELGRALLAAGGTKVRHGHLFTYDFRQQSPPRTWVTPAGIRLTDVDRPVADLLAAHRAAYPADHPDHAFLPGDDAEELAAVIAGESHGPLLAGSGLAVAADGAVVGGILLGTLEGGDPPAYGPWLLDIFRAPGHRGVGRALLARALARATVETLGLIVTDGNDSARRLYETLGFTLVSSAIVVRI